jgi:hypothetical protein
MPKEESGQIFGVWPYADEIPIGFREETPNTWPPQRGMVFFLRYRLDERTPPPRRLTDEAVFLYLLCPAINVGHI